MINTLTKSILRKNAVSSLLDVPKIEHISPDTMPSIFYTENFYKKQKNQIKLGEVIEEQMKYHLLKPTSPFDKEAKSDMLYPYMQTMKVNRDINMIMAKGYFGSQKPSTCVIGNQATARFVRYLQDLEYDAVACDSKRNFTDFTNYILTLNGLQQGNTFTKEKYEFLSGRQFECIDIEVDYSKPYQLAVPALRAVKDGGLLIYTIVQYLTNTRSFGKLNIKKLNLFHDKISCNSETFIQGAVSRFEEIAHDLGKNVEMLFTLNTGNDVGHLTLCMSVHNGKKPHKHFHSYCSTCGKFTNGCEKEQLCNLSGIGPLQIRQFNQNKQFIDKCLEVKKFTNWNFIEGLLLYARSIPADAYLFYINKYFTGEESYSFYEYLGNEENYFVAKSPYHNMLSVYTNMPWNILMGKLHKYTLERGLEPNQYVQSFPTQNLIRQDLPNPVKIEYPVINTLAPVPREIKERRQREYGWKDI